MDKSWRALIGSISARRWAAIALFSATPSWADECIDLSGDAVQGGLLWGTVAAHRTVTLDGTAVSTTPEGVFVIGLGRNAPRQQQLVIGGDAACQHVIEVAPRDYRISRVEGVPHQTVTPPPEQLDRIAKERARVSAAKGRRLPRADWLLAVRSGMAWPATGRISGVYGSQRFYNGTPGSPHYGVDVAVATGHPVIAPAPGLITLAEPDLFYSGGTVILDHGYGLSSSFLHLSEVLVSVGDEVVTGDLLGKVGATGRVTGPHLDWRMSWGKERIDPQLLVPPMPKQP